MVTRSSCRRSCRGLCGRRLCRRRGVRRGCYSARLGRRGDPWGSFYLRHASETTAYSIDATLLASGFHSFPSPGKNGSQVLRALCVCFARRNCPAGLRGVRASRLAAATDAAATTEAATAKAAAGAAAAGARHHCFLFSHRSWRRRE